MKFLQNISVLAPLMVLLSSGVVPAATFQVTKTTDDVGLCDPADCSLREAVLAANALPGADIIDLPAGTYLLTIPGSEEFASLQGDLNIIGDLQIRGSRTGQTVIQSKVADRVMSAQAPPGIRYVIEFSDLGITGGDIDSGGGIYASLVNLTIERSTIWGNTARFLGGGISISVGSLTLIDSTVAENQAPEGGGGGIYSFSLPNGPTDVMVQNSTISGNSALFGGGLLNAGTTLTIVDSTLANNLAPNASAVLHEVNSASVLIEHSLVGGDCNWSNGIFPASGGGNLESPGDTCGFQQPTDQVSVANLGLGPLADNGGPTSTHGLLPGSPAIDAAGSDCGPFDQRGFPRPQDGDLDGVPLCDAGAFEALSTGVEVDVPTLGFASQATLGVLLALAGFVALRRLG